MSGAPQRRTGLIIGIVVAVVVVVGGAGLYWFLRDDAPPPVSLESATAGVGGATDGTTGAGGDGGTVEGIDGTWTVDTDTGEFDFESATGTFVGFRVGEELTIGSTTAVGRTNEVTGEITIADGQLTAATFTADLTALTTNDSRRDNKVQGALETSSFPDATFTLTEPVDLGDGAAAGQELTVDAQGELTIHGVTREVTIPLQAQLKGDTVVVVGSLPIALSDYDVEAPEAPIVLSVSNDGTLEVQFLFTKA